MTSLASEPLTLARALEMVREATRDKSFLELPFGQEVDAYLRSKKKRLTSASLETWETVLHKLVLAFPTASLEDFELPEGGPRLERFMDERWGDCAPRTYNRCLVVINDFFKWQVKRGGMISNPASIIDRAKERDPEREKFSEDEVHAILAATTCDRDQIACRLLLHYGLRRQELLNVRVAHADYVAHELTVFGKGGTVMPLPIPHATFWTYWERWVLESEAQPSHFLMCSAKGNQRYRRELRDEPASVRLLWEWWAERQRDAGVRYRSLHAARRTAGQILLNKTGNIVASQALLRHKDVSTTVKSYAGWDRAQLAASLLVAVEDE